MNHSFSTAIPSYTSLPASPPSTLPPSKPPISSFRYRRKLLIRPRLHLEELSASETRFIIFCTYLTVIGAIIITILVGLGYDEHSIIIPALVPCPIVYNNSSNTQTNNHTTSTESHGPSKVPLYFNTVTTSNDTMVNHHKHAYRFGTDDEQDNVYGSGCIENYIPNMNLTTGSSTTLLLHNPSSSTSSSTDRTTTTIRDDDVRTNMYFYYNIPMNSNSTNGNDNSTRWIGIYNGFTALDGDIKLSIDIIPRSGSGSGRSTTTTTSPQSLRRKNPIVDYVKTTNIRSSGKQNSFSTTEIQPIVQQTTIEYDVIIEGSMDNNNWYTILSIYNTSNLLYCEEDTTTTTIIIGTRSTNMLSSSTLPSFSDTLTPSSSSSVSSVPYCEPFLVFDTASITNGQGAGGWLHYRIDIIFHNWNISTVSQNATMILAWETASYRVADTGVRIAFFILTCLIVLWYSYRLIWQIPEEQLYTSSTTLLASWNASSRKKFHPLTQHLANDSPINTHNHHDTTAVSDDNGSRFTTDKVSVPPLQKVRTYPFQWLPQQRWIIILLCITLLWLNPIFIFTEPLSLISTVTESSSASLSAESIAILRLTTIGLQSVGWSALFCFWWVMADAAKVPKKDIKILAESGLLLHIHSSSSSTPSVRNRKESVSSVASVSACCGCYGNSQYRERSRMIHGVPYPPTSLCGLYGYKLLFFLILSITNGTLQILAHPAIVGQAVAGLSSNMAPALPTGYTLLIIITSLTIFNAFLLLLWIFNFFRALWTTKQQLQFLPYAPTRYHQLAFRFFFFQYLIVVLYVLIINLLPLGNFLYNFAMHPRISIATTSSSSPTTTEETRISVETQILNLVNIVTESWSGVGEVVLVSTYVYILAYCHLPPTNRHIIGIVGTEPSVTVGKTNANDDHRTVLVNTPGNRESTNNYHIVATDTNNSLSLLPSSVTKGIERLTHIVMVPAQVAKQAKQVITATVEKTLGLPLDNTIRANYFSLPLACALFDMSFAAYYDPQGFTPTASGCGIIPTPPHGFTLEGTIYDPITDVFAFVARYQNRIIIAFRGTTSRTHVRTDLNFAPETIYFGDELDSRSLPQQSQHNLGTSRNSKDHTTDTQTNNPSSKLPVTKLTLPSVHMGFWRSYISIRYQLFGVVRSALANAGPTARIYCTGHSLGGALASLAAADIAVNKLVIDNRKAYFTVHGRSQRIPVRLKPRISSFFRKDKTTSSASSTPLLQDTDDADDGYGKGGTFGNKTNQTVIESKRSLSTGRLIRSDNLPETKKEGNALTIRTRTTKNGNTKDHDDDNNDSRKGSEKKPTNLSININPSSSVTQSSSKGKEKNKSSSPTALLSTLNKPFTVRIKSSTALTSNNTSVEEMNADEEAEASATPRAAAVVSHNSSIKSLHSSSLSSFSNVARSSSTVPLVTTTNESSTIPRGTKLPTTTTTTDTFVTATSNKPPQPKPSTNGTISSASSPWNSLNDELQDKVEDKLLEDAVQQRLRNDIPDTVVEKILHPPSWYQRLLRSFHHHQDQTTTSSSPSSSSSDSSFEGSDSQTHQQPPLPPPIPQQEGSNVTADDQYNDLDPLGFGGKFVSDPLDCIGLPPDVEEWDDANDADYLQLLELNTIENTTNLSIQRSIQETLNNSLYCAGDVVTVSFGAPRVGNSIWSVFMNKKVPRSYRIMVDGDLVTSMPSLIGFFRHHGIQVWLDTLGNMIINPSFVEKQFRASSRTSINAHRLVTYRRSLVYARRNEGLPQFRKWVASQLQPVSTSES